MRTVNAEILYFFFKYINIYGLFEPKLKALLIVDEKGGMV